MVEEHKNPDAFRIIEYVCRDCKKVEQIWNSRDGGTPASVYCGSCKGIMLRTGCSDQVDPDHKPIAGDRIIIDITPERSKEILNQVIDKKWDDIYKNQFSSKEEAFKHMYADPIEGEPDIKIVE